MCSERRNWRPKPPAKAACYECGLNYCKFPLDAIVSDCIWELINPSEHEGAGLLCPNCICRRLRVLGATHVYIRVAGHVHAQ